MKYEGHCLLITLPILIFLMIFNPVSLHQSHVALSVTGGETAAIQQQYEHLRSLVSNATSEMAWSMRGVGWLKEQHDLILSILPFNEDSLSIGKHTVQIQDRGFSTTSCNASLISIWVRVSGSSIYAGLAVPHPTKCSWEFSFLIDEPGTYVIEAKLLMYNGNVDHNFDLCNIQHNTNTPDFGEFFSLTGWKFYDNVRSCCEACTRLGKSRCTRWTSPPITPKSGEVCSFEIPPHARQLKQKTITSGTPRNEQIPSFLGCGWSFWLTYQYPCFHGLNDDIIGSGMNITFNRALRKVPLTHATLPLCSTAEENEPYGRWVQNNSLNCGPIIYDPKFSHNFKIIEFDGSNPHCWHRDSIANVGKHCVETGCGKWITQAWKSHMADSIFEGFWKPYRCQYKLFTDKELQQCFDDKKIKSITTDGASIKKFVSQYLNQRLQRVAYSDEGIDVYVSTLKSPHLLWHESFEELRATLNKQPTTKEGQLRFWVNSGFIASEREHHVYVDRSRIFNAIAEPILAAKGWSQLDWFAPGAAFSYDTATQSDGLHIVGPPMKLLIVKLFHYLCL